MEIEQTFEISQDDFNEEEEEENTLDNSLQEEDVLNWNEPSDNEEGNNFDLSCIIIIRYFDGSICVNQSCC